MILSLEIPDSVSEALSPADGDLARRALEGFVIEEYRLDRITRNQLRLMLGFETSMQTDEFLKERRVEAPYTMEDFDREMRNLRALGL